MQAMSDNLYANKHDFSDYARLYTHTVRLRGLQDTKRRRPLRRRSTQRAVSNGAVAVCVEKNCAETRRAEANCAETGPAPQGKQKMKAGVRKNDDFLQLWFE